MKLILIIIGFTLFAGCTGFPFGKKISQETAMLIKNSPKLFSYIKIGGRDISYIYKENKSTNKTIVFIHGSPGDAENFSEYFNRGDLAKQYSLLSIDRPGYEKTKNNEKTVVEVDMFKQAEELTEVISGVLKTEEKIKNTILVGHSFGGPVIAKMAIDNPLKFDKLVFLSASMDPELEKTKWYQYPANWKIFNWLVPDKLNVCNKEIMSMKPYLEKMRGKCNGSERIIGIVHGKKDKLVPVANVKYIEDNFSRSKIFKNILPEADHFIPWSHFDEVIDMVKKVDENN